MAKRQTIWLSTMMVLSLMLIGFYTVNNNVQEVSTDPSKVAANANGQEQPSTTVMEGSDYFVSYHLNAGEEFSKKVEDLNKIIAAGKSAEEVQKAKKDLETMNNNAEKTENLIDLITAEGFRDAIVEIKDGGKVNIVVQAKQIDKKKVVKIMNLAAKELSVSSSKVTVANRE